MIHDVTVYVRTIDENPTVSGRYMVGHRGHCEVMHWFDPKDSWQEGVVPGWQRFLARTRDYRWGPSNPAQEFNATHWWTLPNLDKIPQPEAPLGG